MLQMPFDIIGFWGNEIFFKFDDKIIMLNKRLPKEDLILRLKLEPEDIKEIRDEILVQASKNQLTYDQREELMKVRS